MSQESQPRSWWQTVPGILTAVAGVVTALTGLIIALNQVGLLGSGRGEGAAAALGQVDRSVPSALGDGPVAAAGGGSGAAAAPAYQSSLREVTAGEGRYEFLDVDTRARNPDAFDLRIQVRMYNEGAYPANFWDATFRLLVDGIPRAPVGNLNEVVEGRSAGEGEVDFIVPRSAHSLVLRLHHGNETVDVPLRRRTAG